MTQGPIFAACQAAIFESTFQSERDQLNFSTNRMLKPHPELSWSVKGSIQYPSLLMEDDLNTMCMCSQI
jgi:hypothetical protein